MRDRLFRLVSTISGRVLALFVLVVVAVNAGALTAVLTGDFDSYPEAAWWAFRHVVDPGSLGDDVEWDERIIGTGLMVTGIVVFVGIVLALLTDVVQRSLERLDETQVAVRVRDHVVIFGWSWLTPLMLDEIESIMAGDPATHRPVVVIAPASLRSERDRIRAELRSHHHIFSTDLLFAEEDDAAPLDLARVTQAGSVVVVRDDTGRRDPLAVDVDVIARAALLAERLAGASRPRVAYHVSRDQSRVAASRALPPDFVAIAADRTITGLLRMALFTPAWARLLAPTAPSEMDVEVSPAGRLAGLLLGEVSGALPGRLPLGVRPRVGRFTTAGDRPLEPDDLVVSLPAGRSWPDTNEPPAAIEITDAAPDELHVLVVGWNDNVPVLVDDLAALESTRVRVTSVRDGGTPVLPPELVARTRCTFVEASIDDPDALSTLLESQRPDRIVVVSTVWGAIDPERDLPAADARAVITAALLASVDGARREILVDLYVPASAASLRGLPRVHVLPAAAMQAVMLARLAAGPEGGNVILDVFGDDRAPPLVGRVAIADGRPRPFAAVRAAGLAASASVVGVVENGTPWMAPPPDLPVHPGTEVLMLRSAPHRAAGRGSR